MASMKDEAALRARYEALSEEERADYALISLKIKRFRVFNRIHGREAGDALIEKVYEIVENSLGEGDCIAHIRLDYFNVLLHFPRDYDELFQRIIELNRITRDMEDPRFHSKVFCGFGVYPLEAGVDFLTAQYNADVARAECPGAGFPQLPF